MNDKAKLKGVARKVSRAAEVLGELGDVLSELTGHDDDDDQSGRVSASTQGRGGRAAPGFEGGVDHGSTRVETRTEIDEPEIGWRMGFIRMLDGRCPWCGERMGLVTCGVHSGITWQCPEGCNP